MLGTALDLVKYMAFHRSNLETTFIEQVVEDESQMEGLPNDCSKVMVWHLHLEAPRLAYPPGWVVEKNLDVVVPLKK